MFVVSVRVTHVVLHVSDQSVGPVGNVEGTVGTDFDICWAKVRVFRIQNRSHGCRSNVCSVVVDFVLQDSEKSDAVANQEIVLVAIRKVAAGQTSGGRNGPPLLLKPLLIALAFANIYVRACSTRAVIGKLKSPLIEEVAVRIRADGEVEFHFERAWIESVYARRAGSIRSRRRFHRRDVKDSTRPIQPTIGTDNHRVCRMM